MLRYLGNIILIFGFLFLGKSFLAQTFSQEEEKEWFEADKLFNYGDYLSAHGIYLKLLEKDSTVTELNFKIGVCKFYLNKKTESLSYFHKSNSKKQIETNYYLANVYHVMGQYDKSIEYFLKYKKHKPFDRLFNNVVVNQLIEKSKTAKELESKTDTTIQIKNLGEKVNSPFADFAPKVSIAKNELYFTSKRENNLWQRKDVYGDYYENIFYVKKEKDWLEPIILNKKVNSDLNESCTGISADGHKMLLFRTSEDLKSGNIYESFYFDSIGWDTPQRLNCNVNSDENIETSACYSPDGNSIYFSSNRPGGYGGMDLYVVKKLPNGQWGQAYNLGSEVNTPYNENSPFVHPTGEVIYFCSEGHKNMGGYDIFKASFNERGEYSNPENMGVPINTNEDDMFFVMNTDGKIGYLSSERNGGFGSHDIYEVCFVKDQIALNVYKIFVSDENSKVIKKVEIRLTEKETQQQFGKYKSNRISGKLIIISEPNKEYEVEIEANGYETLKTQINLDKEQQLTFKLIKKDE